MAKEKVFIEVNKWTDGTKSIHVTTEENCEFVEELSHYRTITDTIAVIGQHKDYSYSGKKVTWILDEWNNVLNN